MTDRQATPHVGKRSAEALDALARVSDYMHAATAATGELVCPEHGLDHTGRSARSIVIDCFLYGATAEPHYLRRAESRAATIANRLARDPDHGTWIYHPGRLHPANNSNNVIDSGECTDALSTLILQFGDEIDPDLRNLALDAVTRNCRSYLAGAVVSKEVTNQRLWGAAGLAAAFSLTGDSSWKAAVIESVEISIDDQNPDGSFPYHPRPARFGIHEGAAGVSVYYQSRILAFASYALSLCGELETFRQPLQAGLEFLRAASTPNGYKPLAIESKPWFWAGDAEAGSHPYDIYALTALRGQPRRSRRNSGQVRAPARNARRRRRLSRSAHRRSRLSVPSLSHGGRRLAGEGLRDNRGPAGFRERRIVARRARASFSQCRTGSDADAGYVCAHRRALRTSQPLVGSRRRQRGSCLSRQPPSRMAERGCHAGGRRGRVVVRKQKPPGRSGGDPESKQSWARSAISTARCKEHLAFGPPVTGGRSASPRRPPAGR